MINSIVSHPLIGSDVEYFVTDKNLNVVSAEGYIKGTKKKPHHFGGSKFFATQLDNVLAEGNIPPAVDRNSFINHMRTLRQHIDNSLSEHGLKTLAVGAVRMNKKYLETDNARTFGCDESFNCWTNKVEPVNPTDPLVRSAGFHIHIGYDKPNEEINIAIARLLDASMGLSSVIEEPEVIGSMRKSVGYGRSGNFRNQKHGVEYRSLSSYFAKSNGSIGWAFDAAYRAANALNSYYAGTALREITAAADEIQGAINTHDVRLARKLQDTFSNFISPTSSIAQYERSLN